MKDFLFQMRIKLLIMLICLLVAAPLMAQDTADEDAGLEADSIQAEVAPPPPEPAIFTEIKDSPNDNGHAIDIKWEPAPADDTSGNVITGYQIWRGEKDDATGQINYKLRMTLPYGVTAYTDRGDKDNGADPMYNGKDYYYKIRTLAAGNVHSDYTFSEPVRALGQWFHLGKFPVAVAVIIFFFFTVLFIEMARRGKKLYVRPIAGINAVDEAIGRATEMGKPILYVLGIGTAAEIATICSFTILSRVAKKVAEHQSGLTVPCKDPIVMTVAQEIVKNAYSEAGRPDSYDEDIVFFITQDQFAYVAAVNGQMLRDRPASNFYLGYFAAESLLLAETGSMAGSIQIAGTDQVAQLPFFIVACDYTLIGEELYAGSAYLSQEPLLLGSLKAEDWGKGVFIVLAFLGVIAAALGWNWFIELFKVNL
jgi:hypothetical protein